MTPFSTNPSIRLFNRVSTALADQGIPLEQWCLEHRVSPKQARCALFGTTQTEQGQKLRQRLIAESGIVSSPLLDDENNFSPDDLCQKGTNQHFDWSKTLLEASND
ncbi:MAG: hypothetical protein ACKVJE_20180 [Pseudomonadales bacterium]